MMTYDGTSAIPRIPVHIGDGTAPLPWEVGSAVRVRAEHLHRTGTLHDLAGVPRRYLPGSQEGQGPVGVLGGYDHHHADTHVEGALHLGAVDAPLGLDQIEDRLGPPAGPVDDRV